MQPFQAIILGILEGITEFLPISSTAHLLIAERLFGIEETEFVKSFTIIIQLGAILAVALLYFRRLLKDWETNKRIVAAFIPTGIIGFVVYKAIKNFFFGETGLILVMLFLGGIILILFERFRPKEDAPGIADLKGLPYSKAMLIGCFQALAVIPGVSRSAATIIGGELLGIKRTTIVEFSFLLAIPTMLAASSYDLLKSGASFAPGDWDILAIGFVTAGIFAWLSVRWLLRFIEKHSWTGFGWYRIALAILLAFVLF